MNRFCKVILVLTIVMCQTVQAQDVIADLQLSKSVSNDALQVGEIAEFTLTVTNLGPSVATDVALQDILPSDLTFVTASHPDNFVLSGNILTWSFGFLEVDLSLSVTFQATVTGPIAGGPVVNSATVSSNVFDADEINNVSEVELTVSSGPDPFDTGVMVQIDSFCIDKYEASLQLVPSTTRSVAISVPNTLPAVDISRIDAEQACFEAGKRLCSDSEWLRACRGGSGLIYPYGDTVQPGVCNDLGTLAETGTYHGCVSSDGALDMVGNVIEWTDDPSGTSRGGSYWDTEVNGPGCLNRITAHSASHTDSWTGFRCCAEECVTTLSVEIDVKPGSDPNCFNINGHGVVPVAILGSEVFDVAQVDIGSLYFGGLGVRVRGSKGPTCHIEDTNADGFLDLVCQFEDDAENWSAGGATADLEGTTLDGRQFEASDSICIVP